MPFLFSAVERDRAVNNSKVKRIALSRAIDNRGKRIKQIDIQRRLISTHFNDDDLRNIHLWYLLREQPNNISYRPRGANNSPHLWGEVKEFEERSDSLQLDFKKLKIHTTQVIKFYENNRIDQLHQMEERFVNKVSFTIDKKLTWFFEKEKNIQEANRLVNAAIAIDPSLRVTRDENVVAEAAVVEESTNNLPIPFVLPYI